MPTLTFTSSGTWTALASQVDCQGWGEGGNGGSSLHGSHSGGGGGGGEYAEETTLGLTVSNNYSYTIGAGGTGTNTSFPGDSVTVTAHAGASSAGQGSGSGGSGSANSIHHNGGNGGTGAAGSSTGGAGGGGSAGASGTGGTGADGVSGGGSGGSAGSGGGASGGAGGGNTANGNPGNAPGAGGSGGGSGGSFNHTGGSGAHGQIVITYTSSTAGTATLAGTGTLTATASILTPASSSPSPQLLPGPAWMRYFKPWLRRPFPLFPVTPPVTVHGTATLAGTGTLTALGSLPQPAVVNAWAENYGQGTTFDSITSALQSCVVGLNAGSSIGTGSGVPTAGNWLFCIASWTQDPAISKVHVGVGDDIHQWWRETSGSSSSGNVRTAIAYVPNIGTFGSNIVPQYVYVAPDMEIAAINVIVVEIQGLGPWDTVTGTTSNYAGAATSLSMSLGAPSASAFTIAGVGGGNTGAGQAFTPAGWTTIPAQSQSNGSNHLADNILSVAYLPSTSGSQNVSATATTAEDLSGFMLQVKVSGDNPIPAGHNPAWPYVITEAGFGAGFNTPDSEVTWTDISARPWNWDETTGIQFELGQLQSSNVTIEFDNEDGFLSPLNPASPYYPNVLPGTPIRMRFALGTIGGNTVNRWFVLQRNATQWTEEISGAYRKYCAVGATDLWAAFSSTPPTFYRSEVYEDNPYAWWPMDDQPGTAGVLPTALLNAAIGNTNTLGVALSPNKGAAQAKYTKTGVNASTGQEAFPPGVGIYTVGANAGWMFGDPPGAAPSLGTGNPVEPTPGSASWQALGQAGNTGSYGWYLICNDASFPAISSGITVEIWFNYAFYGTADGYTSNSAGGPWSPVTGQPYNTPLTIWELASASAPVARLQLDTSGHLNLIIGGSTTFSVYSSSDLRSGSWHMATVTLTSSSYAVWVDGGATAQVSGAASPSSSWSYFIVNADFGGSGGGAPGNIVHGGNGAFSHAAIYPYVLPYYRVMDHYWAACTAFGQLPAPTATQITWGQSGTGPFGTNGVPGIFAPDGTAGYLTGAYSATSGINVSAVVTATAPGGITSGPSAWTAQASQYATLTGTPTEFLWIGWNGLAPSYSLYTSQTVGSETEAAVVNGSGDSFNSGFGGSASGAGVCQTAGGDGSSPPAAGSAIGDAVGERIERLMRGGRCSSPNRCIDPAPLLVQAPGTQGGGVQVGAAIQAIQQSDSGMLFVDNLNHLTYWQRPHLASQYSSPVWNIGPSAGKYPYHREIQWVTDPHKVFNTIAIEPLSPTGASLPELTPSNASAVLASQIRYGAQPLSVTSWLQSTAEMQAQADWLLSTYGTPRRRAQNVHIDAASNPAFWPLVAGVNVGDVVTVEDWQVGGGGTVYTMRVTEIQRHFEYGANAETGASEVSAYVVLTLDYEPTSYWS